MHRADINLSATSKDRNNVSILTLLGKIPDINFNRLKVIISLTCWSFLLELIEDKALNSVPYHSMPRMQFQAKKLLVGRILEHLSQANGVQCHILAFDAVIVKVFIHDKLLRFDVAIGIRT